MNRTFFFDSARLPGGWRRNVRLEVRAGVIERLGADAAPEPGDERFGMAIPGLPNVHSHAFQRAMAGLAERLGPAAADDFWSWREVMYRFLAHVEPDDVQAIAAYAYADMLEAGFTSVGEFNYLHRSPQGTLYEDPAELTLRHVAAAELTGIGLTLLPVFYESSRFGGAPPTPGQRRFITSLDTFAAIVDRVRGGLSGTVHRNAGIAAHSLRAVTADHLHALLRQYPDGPFHIHAAEQVKEVDDCVAFCGQRPIEWLLRNAGVTPRWCLVHATHLTPQESTALAATGAVVGLCPVTEANLGDGIFPAAAYRAAAGRWAVGTDSHILLDAAGELRQLEYSQRLAGRSRNVLADPACASTGESLYQAALAGGAQALALPVGAIAPGYRADFLILDTRHPDLAGRGEDTVIDTWVFAVGRTLIHDVIAGGRTVVQNRRHIDRDRIDSAYRRTVTRLSQNT
jgi:formimidoylglutamate deiminase